MKKVIYPGSFDPITNGHLDIIKRASHIFDGVIIAVGNNTAKTTLFSVDERIALIKKCTETLPNVEIKQYSNLTVDFVKESGTNLIIRGTRDSQDYNFENRIANLNRLLDSDVETLLMLADKKYELVSSSMVKEVLSFGGDISQFVPQPVEIKLKEKFNNEKN
ncbi:pantetheine-phosphate adenylyltransferase [Fructilactobacillus vespulae]|uniref:pantetheine-phosphate adenylyltransferase n=1 Tax=Fructilactobacillus vespulae TaxID=1249630 RepID=UPI0039B5AEE1